MVAPQEIELLGSILQRAGVTQIEAMWLNDLLGRLRAMVMPESMPDAEQSEEIENHPER